MPAQLLDEKEDEMEDIVEKAVRRVIEQIRENLGEELTLDDMARTAMFRSFTSPDYFRGLPGSVLDGFCRRCGSKRLNVS
jgi:hypothetical protein